MKQGGEAGKVQRQNILSALILLPVIAWEIYGIWFGSLVQACKNLPPVLLVFAFFGALYAAWSVVQFEYFPTFDLFSRKSQVWFTVGIDLWCTALILLWLEPRLALPVLVSIFGIGDLIGFQALRELLHRASSRVPQ